MMVRFCPQCGHKVEESFIFCSSCGVKLPKEEDVVSEPPALPESSSPIKTVKKTPVKRKCSPQKEASRSPAKQQGQSQPQAASPNQPQAQAASPNLRDSAEQTPTARITRARRKCDVGSAQKGTDSTPEKQDIKSVETSPAGKLGLKSKTSPRGKRAKVEPLPENEIVTDNTTTKWLLAKLLTHGNMGILYEAYSPPKTDGKQNHILKLDAKDAKIFNEQNFLQRAAKKNIVDKWKKSHSCSLLGIPNCIGFGHLNNYRFLVFSALGQNLQSVINTNNGPLSEKAVYQISYRMIDALEYIHENEYVHGDITAENIFVNLNNLTEVYLAGYYFAFRFCPDGKHVAYKDGSRTSHEGTAEFISLDLHKGVGPSRRSDLESLGYCMLKWLCGSLPWSGVANANTTMEQKKSYKTNVPGLLEKCCNRKKVPEVLKTYLEHVMGLNYEEKPDYNALRENLSAALKKMKASPYEAVDL